MFKDEHYMGGLVFSGCFCLWIFLNDTHGPLIATIIVALIALAAMHFDNKYDKLWLQKRQSEERAQKREENLRHDLHNKYASWERQLQEQESALKKKEKNLLFPILVKEENFNREYQKKTAELQNRENILSTAKSVEVKKFPVIADIFTDYHLAYDDYVENFLRNKPRPAKTAADNVKLLRQQKKELFSQLYAYKWELDYLRKLLPWIEDLEDSPMQEIKVSTELALNEDAALKWITPTEYETLSNAEKYQLALDRYINKKKSRLEIGRDYERYIGYLYEMAGYKVDFFGIRKGLEDLGRDLICEKDGQTHIVQCKCWSKTKEIHENHINQLFGTTALYYLSTLPNNTTKRKTNMKKFIDLISKEKIIPIFFSTTKYSEKAVNTANILGIQLKIKELAPHPMVKCNINPSTKERIYHLPFDQQYDHCMINPEIGEFYAETVQEAEDNGFRRAQHWSGTFHK